MVLPNIHGDMEGGESAIMLFKGELGSAYMGIGLLVADEDKTSRALSELPRRSCVYADPNKLQAGHKQHD